MAEPKHHRDNEAISPLKPDSMPRAEDDADTIAHSPEFHDRPDPGPNVGKARDATHSAVARPAAPSVAHGEKKL
jgi:hypothetical protein